MYDPVGRAEIMCSAVHVGKLLVIANIGSDYVYASQSIMHFKC